MGCGKSSLADVADDASGSKDEAKKGTHSKKEGGSKTSKEGGGSKTNKNKKDKKDKKNKEGGESSDEGSSIHGGHGPGSERPPPPPKPRIYTKLHIIVLGGPGSGKASLCTRMAEEYDFLHVCVGNLLRAEVQKNSSIGKQVSELMKEGKLVPPEIPLKLLKEHIHAGSSKLHVLVDGYPKTLEQAKKLKSEFSEINMIIYLECPPEKLEQRLLLRAQTGERSDDKSETIQKRLDHFNTEYMELVKFYETNYPYDFVKIKAGSLQKVEVFLEVATHMKEMFNLEARSALVHKKHDCNKTEYIFILGGPGCGKGTQCKHMVKDFGYTHISTGDLLRNEVKSGTNIGKEVEALMKAGKLVPNNITIGLLENAIRSSGCKHFLIDGYPRSLEQAHAFEEKIGKPGVVIFLSCSTSTMEKRLLERGKTSKRTDDNVEVIKLRFETYQKESKPVIDYYKGTKKLKEVSAEKDPESIYKHVKEALLETVEKPPPPPAAST
ncbi:hypothetical protein GOP47_0012394 [Adiantum capillus-veneris]|uniref:adenylate kinase n=1 Tax=Adiantum capillus-veneris TaxID=13818 RepID=A0A9D4URZ2_ADICA|nr:hypothetical protein GOP47_0012394 [Adiantum capillus-veneris]